MKFSEKNPETRKWRKENQVLRGRLGWVGPIEEPCFETRGNVVAPSWSRRIPFSRAKVVATSWKVRVVHGKEPRGSN